MPPFEIVHNLTRTGSPMYAMTNSHCGLVPGYLTQNTPGIKIKVPQTTHLPLERCKTSSAISSVHALI